MDLSFLDGKEKEDIERLLAVSGNSLLMGAPRFEEIISKSTREEYIDSCGFLDKAQTRIASKNRDEDQLFQCLMRAAKKGNQGVGFW